MVLVKDATYFFCLLFMMYLVGRMWNPINIENNIIQKIKNINISNMISNIADITVDIVVVFAWLFPSPIKEIVAGFGFVFGLLLPLLPLLVIYICSLSPYW